MAKSAFAGRQDPSQIRTRGKTAMRQPLQTGPHTQTSTVTLSCHARLVTLRTGHSRLLELPRALSSRLRPPHAGPPSSCFRLPLAFASCVALPARRLALLCLPRAPGVIRSLGGPILLPPRAPMLWQTPRPQQLCARTGLLAHARAPVAPARLHV